MSKRGVMVPQNVPIEKTGALDKVIAKVWYDRTHKPDHVAPIGGTRKKAKTGPQQRRRAANKAAKRARRRNR